MITKKRPIKLSAVSKPPEGQEDICAVEDSIESGPLINLLSGAIKENADEIWFVPEDEGCRVFMAIDGVRHPVCSLPQYLYDEILIRIKLKSGVLPEDKNPAVSRMEIIIDGIRQVFHLSFFPINGGNRVVIRINRSFWPGLPGLSKQGYSKFSKLLQQKTGLFLICGHSGSGRSATMETAIRLAGDVPAIILEDRVGPAIDSIDRVYRNPWDGAKGLDRFLPHILSQNYKVSAIDNIDAGDFPVLLRAARAGLKIIATAYSSGPREMLEEILFKGDLFSAARESLRGILHQHRERISCTCGNQSGCEKCRFTGFFGTRCGFSLLQLDEQGQKPIKNSVSHEELLKSIKVINLS